MKSINLEKAVLINDIQKFVDKYETIYLYGAGKYGQILLNQLLKKGSDIKAVVVSDKTGNEDKVMGVPVISIDEISVDNENIGFILGVSNNYKQEIIISLQEYGHANILQIEDIKALEGKIGWQTLAKMPKLEITAKIGCSIQCKYCPQQALYHSYFKNNQNRCTVMNFEDYKKCIDKTPGNTVISFAGFVEPFHHPQAVEMIRYAYESGRPVELFTTLVGMTEGMFEQIKDIPFIEVVLHTPDRDGYANIPMTDEYVRVLDKVLDQKKPNGSPFVDSANCQSEPSEQFLKVARGRIEVKSVLIDRAGNLEADSLKTSRDKKGKLYCRRSLKQNHWVLLPDGTVVLCCMDFGMKHVLGNLIASDYKDIVNGMEYQNIRKEMISGSGNRGLLCRNCTSAGSVDELGE